MSRATVLVAALVALVLALTWWLWSSEPAAPPATPSNAAAPSSSPASPASPAPAPATAPVRSPTDDARTAATAPDRTASATPTSAQGLRGTVVDAQQRPLAGLAVFLVDSAGNDPVALPMLAQQGAMSPIASAETADDGSFAVGVPVAQDRLYELYVVSRVHATARLGGLRLLAGKWHELPPITMTAGAVIRGRVTVVNRDDLPVWPATVAVEIGGAFADAALRSLPSAGHGLVATTDANGAYELRNVPSRGVVQVSAVAPNFARQVKTNVELTLDRPVEVNFGLSPGVAIRGDVVDGRGRTVAGARVEAWPMAAAGGPFPGVSDDAGRFEVLGLAPGTYRLRVEAAGYERHDVSDIAADRNDVRCVLYEQSRLRVQVVTPAGDTLRSYQLALRRVFPERNDQIAVVFEVPEQRVRLDGLTDTIELTGVPIGTFVCQVEAEGFAKTLSDPIDNVRAASDGPRQLSTVVRMRLGASLRGRVQTEDGRPLAGATVLTQAAGTQPDSPLTRLLAGALPDRITATRALTGADGTFTLSRLALADYQLQIEHTDACRHLVPDVRLDRDGDHELPVIVVRRGALVGGRVTVAGRVVGQIKVVLATTGNVAAPQDAIRLETITDPEGRYRFARRVPPGNYELRAAVVGTSEPEAQIFRQLLQLQRSSTTLSVAPGQAQVERDIDLPSDH